mgnify:CR=1 FL=1
MSGAFVRSSYLSVLADYGISHAAAWEQSCNTTDLDGSPIEGLSIKESPIHGSGLFADKSYESGAVICRARTGGMRTLAGRYSNHSPFANAQMRLTDEDVELVSVCPISEGEEITTDYGKTLSLSLERPQASSCDYSMTVTNGTASIEIAPQDRGCMSGHDAAAYDLLFNEDHINCLSLRDRVLAFEYVLEGLPQIDIPVKHEFIKGLYRREVTFPKGMLATGKIHPEDHMDVMLSGEMIVASEDGFKRLKGPCTLTSRAGHKKAGYAITEVVWATYHPTSATTVEAVEKELTIDDFDEIAGECEERAV